MSDEVRVDEVTFASADGTSTIQGYVWAPVDTPMQDGLLAPRGVVQLVHGMAEHITRYDEFARFLAAAGFVVAGHDQIGHGKSSAPEKWGCLPAATGKEIMVEDVHQLRGIMEAHVAKGTPYIIFGHSLGSFITRAYLARHGEGLAGAVICGTGFVPVATSKAGNAMARLIGRLRGEDYKSGLLSSMGVGAYAKAIKDAKTELDWLSYRQENIDAYMADEACGFPFSAGGYATVTSLTAEVCDIVCCTKVPKALPLLFVAGDGDPVGSMGEGVRASAELAQKAGSTDVTVKIYEHMRHEILNEDGRAQVMADILAWIEERI